MPNPNELARVEEEAAYTDDEMILDGLKTRARRLGYSSLTAALDALEEEHG